jgi:hypothetical protein
MEYMFLKNLILNKISISFLNNDPLMQRTFILIVIVIILGLYLIIKYEYNTSIGYGNRIKKGKMYKTKYTSDMVTYTSNEKETIENEAYEFFKKIEDYRMYKCLEKLKQYVSADLYVEYSNQQLDLRRSDYNKNSCQLVRNYTDNNKEYFIIKLDVTYRDYALYSSEDKKLPKGETERPRDHKYYLKLSRPIPKEETKLCPKCKNPITNPTSDTCFNCGSPILKHKIEFTLEDQELYYCDKVKN